MAKIKLLHFSLIAMLEDSKRLMDYLQRLGIAELSDVEDPDSTLTKYQTSALVQTFTRKQQQVNAAVETLERSCRIKRSFVQQFTDTTDITYYDYRRLCENADNVMQLCEHINALQGEIDAAKQDILRRRTKIDYYRPWEALDLPMNTRRTASAEIFIGQFKSQLEAAEILSRLAVELPETEGISAEVVSAEKLQTCAVIVCHRSDAADVEHALKAIGFVRPDNPAKTLPRRAIEQCEAAIKADEERIAALNAAIAKYAEHYDSIRMLADYYAAQSEKYRCMEKAATSSRTVMLEGYVPERSAEGAGRAGLRKRRRAGADRKPQLRRRGGKYHEYVFAALQPRPRPEPGHGVLLLSAVRHDAFRRGLRPADGHLRPGREV